MARATTLHFDTVKRLIRGTKQTVYFPYYPLAPSNNVQDALNWLEQIYSKIIHKYPSKQISFVGDSAGANLVISLTNRIEEIPGKLIAISLAAGLRNGEDRNTRKKLEVIDPILTVEMNDLIAVNWARGVSLDSPDINPNYVSFKDFPKLMFIYGEHELFYPHVKRLLHKLDLQKINYIEIEKPMCHDWALCSFFPEGKEAIRKMCDFLSV